jgi:two-component system cell cycle sensor histidine kinase/response regulator CckA
VLIVEDDPNVQRYLEKVLKDKGFAVLSASNGIDAYNYYQKFLSHIDLVFTDIILHGMTGLDLIEKIQVHEQQNPPNKSIKFLITSGYSFDVGQDRLLAERNLPFLPKPYTMDILLEIINKILK